MFRRGSPTLTTTTTITTTVYDDAPMSESFAGSTRASSDARTRAKDQIVMPAGNYTIGGTLGFMMAPKSPFQADESLRFTDVVLLGLGGRLALGGRAEVAASVAFLPKQPSFADEFAVQGVSLSARVAFARRYAGWARASGGPTFGTEGKWAAIAVGLETQKSLHDFLQVHGQFGMNTVGLFANGADGDKLKFKDPAWFTEAIIGADLVTFDKRTFAAWIGTSFHFPVGEFSESAMMDLKPSTRANFHLGTVFSGLPKWDLLFDFSVIDRGDVNDAATTLPILTGGFDQAMISFGMTRRYKRAKAKKAPPTMVIGR